jgi:hypothetical protein
MFKKTADKKIATKTAKLKPEQEETHEPMTDADSGEGLMAIAETHSPQPQNVGDTVVYVAPDGVPYPATITGRYGTHSALRLEDGVELASVRYDESGAKESYRLAE